MVVAASIAAIADMSYRWPLVPLSVGRRWGLTALRACSLAAVVFFLCRPLVLEPPSATGDVVVPVLVYGSRSMRIADADGQPRIARAKELLDRELLPALSKRFKTELYAFGDTVAAAEVKSLGAA